MTRRAMQLSGPVTPPPVRRYGYVDYDKWKAAADAGVHLHVWLDGKDITTRCKSADDETGTVLAYKRDPQGRKHLPKGPWESNEVVAATEVLRGDVLIAELKHDGTCAEMAGREP